LVLAACGGSELWAKTQEAYFQSQTRPFVKLVSCIVNHDLRSLVIQTDLNQWQVTLALLCTYSTSDDFPVLCGNLATLLEHAGNLHAATLCYICANDLENTVRIWAMSNKQQADPIVELQVLIEKAAVFQQAIHQPSVGPLLASKYTEYATLLAAEGKLEAAQRYVAFARDAPADSPAAVLLDRITNAYTPSSSSSFSCAHESSSVYADDSSSTAVGSGNIAGSHNDYGFAPEPASFNYSLNESAKFETTAAAAAAPTNADASFAFAPSNNNNAYNNNPAATGFTGAVNTGFSGTHGNHPTTSTSPSSYTATYSSAGQNTNDYYSMHTPPAPTNPYAAVPPTSANPPVAATTTPPPAAATPVAAAPPSTATSNLAQAYQTLVERHLSTAADQHKIRHITSVKAKLPALSSYLSSAPEAVVSLAEQYLSGMSSLQKPVSRCAHRCAHRI
jgi:hypothetical protein